jgi:hypothetical protein
MMTLVEQWTWTLSTLEGGKETQSCVTPTDNVYYFINPFHQQWDDNTV